jgi:hypothetical protein
MADEIPDLEANVRVVPVPRLRATIDRRRQAPLIRRAIVIASLHDQPSERSIS